MENEPEKQEDLDSWDNYVAGSFLKSVNVKNTEQAFIVVGVSEEEIEGVKRPRLNLESEGQKFDFDINKTNAVKLKELGVPSPRALIEKKIYFMKVMVRNPRLNKEVEGLRIHGVN